MVVASEHTLPQLVEGAAHSGHHHRRKHCCRSSSSRQQRACKHKGRLGGGRRARGPLIPVQEQQGRNQGRLERERKQRKNKKRWIWARHQEQRDLEWREGNKGGEDGRLGVPSEHTPVLFARRRKQQHVRRSWWLPHGTSAPCPREGPTARGTRKIF